MLMACQWHFGRRREGVREQGVLAIFNGAYDRNEDSTTNYIIPSKRTAIYTGGRQQRTHFTLHFLYQGVAHIPAAGKASLINTNVQLVGAES
jgi:hypothetical protein